MTPPVTQVRCASRLVTSLRFSASSTNCRHCTGCGCRRSSRSFPPVVADGLPWNWDRRAEMSPYCVWKFWAPLVKFTADSLGTLMASGFVWYWELKVLPILRVSSSFRSRQLGGCFSNPAPFLSVSFRVSLGQSHSSVRAPWSEWSQVAGFLKTNVKIGGMLYPQTVFSHSSLTTFFPK